LGHDNLTLRFSRFLRRSKRKVIYYHICLPGVALSTYYFSSCGVKIISSAGISTSPSLFASSSPYIALKTAIGDFSPSRGLGYELTWFVIMSVFFRVRAEKDEPLGKM